MSEEQAVGGPILDAIKNKIAEIINDPTDFIALVKLLVSLLPKDEGVFTSSDPRVAELVAMLHQASDNGS